MANERIFISYKRVDKTQVFALIDKIEHALGVKCWVDLEGIESSAQFASKICSAIDRAEVVLFMHSSAHLSIDYDNDWTVRELDYAHSLKKRVVLVKLDDAPLRNIFQLIYGSRNNIDSRNPDQWNNLLRDLRLWLNLPAPSAPPSSQSLKPFNPPTSNSLQELEARLVRLDREVGRLHVVVKDEYGRIREERIDDVMNPGLLYGYADESGKIVVSLQWKHALSFHEGLAGVMDANGRWGFIDKMGNVVIPYRWKFVSGFQEGLAGVVDATTTLGFIDKTGSVVIPCQWDNFDFCESSIGGGYGKHFSEGLCAVRNNQGKWGYINRNGTVVIPCRWNGASRFISGKAVVQGKVGLLGNSKDLHYIDKTGQVIGKAKEPVDW